MCVNTPWRVLSSAFLRTVCRPGDENVDWHVQLAGGERALSCLITKSAQHRLDRNTSVSFTITIVLAKDLTNIWGSEGVGRHLDQCTRGCWPSQFFCKEKMKHQRIYINILILKYLWLPHDVVVLYTEIFFLTAEVLHDFKEQPATDRQTPPPFDISSGLRISFRLTRERKGQLDKKMEKTKGDFKCSLIAMNSSELTWNKLQNLWYLPIMNLYNCLLWI